MTMLQYDIQTIMTAGTVFIDPPSMLENSLLSVRRDNGLKYSHEETNKRLLITGDGTKGENG
jgi:hypothetical protein